MKILRNMGLNSRDRRFIQKLYMGQKVQIKIENEETEDI